MRKIVSTVIFSAGIIAGLVWACSYNFTGLSWFPGFFVALFCGIELLDVYKVGQNPQKQNRF